MFLTLTACEKTEETIDRFDDVLDTEPYDKIRDKAEDVRDEIKVFVTETQEDMEDVFE